MNGIFGGVTQGALALVPLYAAERYGINALDSGTLLVAQGAAAIVLSITAALVLRRTGNRMPLYIGATVIVAGLLLTAVTPVAGISPYLWLAGAAFLIGAGGGTINPASRNAGLQLEPEHSSTLAALRSMSMQIGSITTISVATAVLTGAEHPGALQSWVYVATASLLLLSLPLIPRVPEHHGAW